MKECTLCRAKARFRIALGHASVWGCTSPACGLLFADPQLDEQRLADAYARHYYSPNDNSISVAFENTPEEILEQTFDLAEATWGRLGGKELLDFGCGIGGLCKVAKRRGLRVEGIEADAIARKRAYSSANLQPYGSLDEFRESRANSVFDIITMWDVIEHLREPWKVLENLADFLKPGGLMLLSTPNAGSLRSRILGKRWENMANPTHFYYFTRKSLTAVLRRAGFHEATELRFPVHYPEHGMARRVLQQGLTSCRLQGELVYVARLGIKKSAGKSRSVSP